MVTLHSHTTAWLISFVLKLPRLVYYLQISAVASNCLPFGTGSTFIMPTLSNVVYMYVTKQEQMPDQCINIAILWVTFCLLNSHRSRCRRSVSQKWWEEDNKESWAGVQPGCQGCLHRSRQLHYPWCHWLPEAVLSQSSWPTINSQSLPQFLRCLP